MKNGTTALMVTASRRAARARPARRRPSRRSRVLLERGADVNAATPDGATALHRRVGRGDDGDPVPGGEGRAARRQGQVRPHAARRRHRRARRRRPRPRRRARRAALQTATLRTEDA